MATNYQVIQLPVPLRLRELDRTQAKIYNDWFHNQILQRINELTKYIKATPGFENWEGDFTQISLDKLGVWFCQQVTTRKLSEKEIQIIYSKSPDWFNNIKIPDYDISALSVSLSIDIAMYISQVMQKNINGLRWKMVTSPKSSINYQQPVLYGKGEMVFNPVHIIITYAYGIAAGERSYTRLRELYDIWVNILNEQIM
jgi:hypothetical protein